MTRKETFEVIKNAFEAMTFPADTNINAAIVELCEKEIERLNNRKSAPRKISEEEQKKRDRIDTIISQIMEDGIARSASDIRDIIQKSNNDYSNPAITASCKRLVEEKVLTIAQETRNKRIINVYQKVN